MFEIIIQKLILDQCLSGEPLDEVAVVDPGIIYEIFGRELSTGKGLGLTGKEGFSNGNDYGAPWGRCNRHLASRGW